MASPNDFNVTLERKGKVSSKPSLGTASQNKGKVNKQALKFCPHCNQSFRRKTALLSHIKWKHEKESSKMCEKCGKIFVKVFRLKRHQLLNCESLKTDADKKIKCCLCDFMGCEKRNVFNHYVYEHKIIMETTTEQFKNLEDFMTWKSDFEVKTNSCFVKTHSSWIRRKDSVEIAHYVCHRDGMYVPSGKSERQCKVQGSNKINAHCPAKMVVQRSCDFVKVFCVTTHIGHELELSRMYFTKAEKAFVAERLASRVPFEQILSEIQDSSTNSELRRIHLVTRKDLWNLVHSLSPKGSGIQGEHDYAVYKDKKVRQIDRCHRKALQMNKITVTRTDSSWLLESKKEIQNVKKSKDECECQLRCMDCEACVHSFNCTCVEFSIRWNMCEHIHFVCQLLKAQSMEVMEALSGLGVFEPVIIEPLIEPINTDVDEMGVNSVEAATEAGDAQTTIVDKCDSGTSLIDSEAGELLDENNMKVFLGKGSMLEVAQLSETDRTSMELVETSHSVVRETTGREAETEMCCERESPNKCSGEGGGEQGNRETCEWSGNVLHFGKRKYGEVERDTGTFKVANSQVHDSNCIEQESTDMWQETEHCYGNQRCVEDVLANQHFDCSLSKGEHGKNETVDLSSNMNDNFEKRKCEVLNKILQIHNSIENKEQLEAFECQIAILKTIIEALSRTEIVLVLSPDMIVPEPPRKKVLVQRV